MGVLDFIGDIFGVESQSNVAGAQMAFNAKEASKNRQFQREMWHSQNAYNDPSAQRDRMLKAGLNPWSPEGQGYASSSVSHDLPQGSQAAPFTPVGQYYNPISTFKELSLAVKSIADAKKAGVETNRLEAFTEEELQSLILKNESQGYMNTMLGIDSKYHDQKVTQQLNKVKEEISLIIANKDLSEQQKSESIQRVTNLINETHIQESEKNLLIQQYTDLIATRDARIKEIQSRTSANYAQGNMFTSQANLNNAYKEFQDFQNDLNKSTSKSQKEALAQKFIEKAKQYGIETNQMREALEKAKKDNDWYAWHAITDKVIGAIGAIHPFIGTEDTFSTEDEDSSNVTDYDKDGKPTHKQVGQHVNKRKTSRVQSKRLRLR